MGAIKIESLGAAESQVHASRVPTAARRCIPGMMAVPAKLAMDGAILIDGKAVAAKVRHSVSVGAQEFQSRFGRLPGLAVVQVGDDHASSIYVRNKRKSCEDVGIASFAHDLPGSTTEAQLLALVHALNLDERVDGILVQLPLPPGIDASRVIEAIYPAKDVDGLHPINVGLLAQKRPRLRPCTPYGVMTLAAEYGIAMRGLRATVVGASQHRRAADGARAVVSRSDGHGVSHRDAGFKE